MCKKLFFLGLLPVLLPWPRPKVGGCAADLSSRLRHARVKTCVKNFRSVALFFIPCISSGRMLPCGLPERLAFGTCTKLTWMPVGCGVMISPIVPAFVNFPNPPFPSSFFFFQISSFFLQFVGGVVLFLGGVLSRS